VDPRHSLAAGRPEPERQPQPRIKDGRDSNLSEVNEMVSSFKSRSPELEHRHSILNDFVISEAKGTAWLPMPGLAGGLC
jgi:hypothetical protein